MIGVLWSKVEVQGKAKEDHFRHTKCISISLGAHEFSAWPWLLGNSIIRRSGGPGVKVPSQFNLSIKLRSSLLISTLRFLHVFYVSIFLNEYLLAWVILPLPPKYIYSEASTFNFSETTTSIDIYFLGSKKTLSMSFGKILFGVWLVEK